MLQHGQMTISEMVNGLSAGDFSAVEIASGVINQIEATSDLGALIEFNESFYKAEAIASDKRRSQNKAGKLEILKTK